jgi:hypothetical protein
MVSKSVKFVEQSYKSASNAPDRDNRLQLAIVENGPGHGIFITIWAALGLVVLESNNLGVPSRTSERGAVVDNA